MKSFRIAFVFMVLMLHIIAQAAPLKSTADGWLTFGGIQSCGGGSDPWAVSGKVYATVIGSSGELYIGGDFTFCGDVIVNHIARYENGHWYALGSDKTNGVDDIVNAIAIGSRGELYVGGSFTQAGGQTVNHIAQWNGSSWSSLGTGNANGVNDVVQALAIVGSTLYTGGKFTQAGGQTANHIAQWNGSSWSSLGTGNANGVDDVVQALTLSGSTLYVGGKFTQAGGQAANHIAQWNGSSWSSLGTGNANGVNDLVQALTLSGSTLYVGGKFTQAGGQTVNYIAQWNGSSWSSLNTNVRGEIRSLIVSDSILYVGGDFSIVGVPNSADLAQWNIGSSSWSRLGSFVGDVNALAISDQTLYAGGSGIAQWNGSNWYPLISSGANGMNNWVSDLKLSGSTLYASGEFTKAGGQIASKIAKWNGSNWSPIDTGTEIQNSVSTLAVAGQNLYIGGDFFKFAGGQWAGRIANSIVQWDGSAWYSLANPQTSAWGVMDDIYYSAWVSALAMSGANLYVAGHFNKASNQAVNNIAQWNGSSWSSLGMGITGVNGYVNGNVNALAISGQTLYVGGQFTQAGGQSANNIAQWDTALHTWLPLRGVFGDEGIPGSVYAFALAKKTSSTQIINGQLAVGGQFTAEIHSRLHPACLAMWDPIYGEWRNIAPTDIFKPGCTIYAMTWLDDELYVGGSGLSSDRDAPDYYLARLKFSTLGTTLIITRFPLGHGVNGGVRALATDASKNLIYVGGSFNRVGIGGRVSSKIAIWQKNVVFQNGLEPDSD